MMSYRTKYWQSRAAKAMLGDFPLVFILGGTRHGSNVACAAGRLKLLWLRCCASPGPLVHVLAGTSDWALELLASRINCGNPEANSPIKIPNVPSSVGMSMWGRRVSALPD